MKCDGNVNETRKCSNTAIFLFESTSPDGYDRRQHSLCEKCWQSLFPSLATAIQSCAEKAELIFKTNFWTWYDENRKPKNYYPTVDDIKINLFEKLQKLGNNGAVRSGRLEIWKGSEKLKRERNLLFVGINPSGTKTGRVALEQISVYA